MSSNKIDLVLVADGERVICLRPKANGWQHFEIMWELERKALQDHMLGRDRPGRYRSAPFLPMSSHEEHSKHHAGIVDFLRLAATRLEQTFNAEHVERIAIIASPVSMGILRSLIPGGVRGRVSKEVLRDYTRTPHERLEQLLAASLI